MSTTLQHRVLSGASGARPQPPAKGAERAPGAPALRDVPLDTDDAILEGLRAGPPRDRPAFEALYQRYAPVVHSIVLARLGAGEAPDVTQEVFISVWRSAKSLRIAGALGPWICTVARNAAASWVRTKARRGTILRLTPLDEARSMPEAAREEPNLDAAHALLEEIRRLPEAYRETLLMRLVQNLSGPEIAERTGLTHGSVRVNLTRGMALLRERLQHAEARS